MQERSQKESEIGKLSLQRINFSLIPKASFGEQIKPNNFYHLVKEARICHSFGGKGNVV
jgi:hypothetical protein